MARMEIISGIERRRRWPVEVKLTILAEASQPGARVCDVARRHDVHPSQIRVWRRTLCGRDDSPSFLPVRLVDNDPSQQVPSTVSPETFVRISLRNGRSLKVPANIERETLASLIACVEAA
ncbi:IS66-like element accessory protein TnpA (plasmid) [Agrobacterium rosae]|uniref:IS66-like element accessory protein TnpA n=1 Tax=Agrobacterium rosae TaxID=1972867 RepID=UPI003D791C15